MRCGNVRRRAPWRSGRTPAGQDGAQYWESRLARGSSLDTVGFIGLGTPFDAWMYRVRRTQFLARVRRAMRRSGIDAPRASVLNVGSDSGFYIGRRLELGVKSLWGRDITDAVARRQAAKFPNASFERMDIGAYDSGERLAKWGRHLVRGGSVSLRGRAVTLQRLPMSRRRCAQAAFSY